jgi:hypothetical protein
MKSIHQAFESIASQPTPAALVGLQGALLASGYRGEMVKQALAIAGRFHTYLCELQSKITARDYSELASRLDVGAVGAVALESLIDSDKDELWQRVLMGGLGETLMVAASRQYIKAWEAETGPIHACAAWYLAEALWDASREMQPELRPDKRWAAIQALLEPAHHPDVPAPDKAILLGRIFQMLLLTHIARMLPGTKAGTDD